ncbi:hypothetical protein E1287_24910 [Actinomadura sp. KC06]|uniref:hypothetical protein n=1 Tax=Actinomadura sp. KC06 TaxID=2530369 RepID=UPI0010466E36|nr:hypothetical protein [Actinomadura sp. KC06]TDD31869.1 hypothetical protein E1287_24910 [Actinomadura sp. KC06]
MPSTRLRRSGLAALTTAVAVAAGALAQADLNTSDHGNAAARETTGKHATDTHAAKAQAAEAHGITAEELEASGSKLLDPPPGGWPVPSRRSYYLQASCQQHAATIARGAAAWQGFTQGGGTPVECRNTYISDCGGGGRIVGCNWGRGQRIALYMGGVRDGALLAAHEFGHDWYGHSSYQCAGWGSAQEVMAPSMCGIQKGQKTPLPID